MIFGPYPGSADWKALVDEGIVVVDDDYHYVALSRGSSQAVSYNPRMTARQLRFAADVDDDRLLRHQLGPAPHRGCGPT